MFFDNLHRQRLGHKKFQFQILIFINVEFRNRGRKKLYRVFNKLTMLSAEASLHLDKVIEPPMRRRFSMKRYDAAIYFENDVGQLGQVEKFCVTKNFELVQIPESPAGSPLTLELSKVAQMLQINPANLYVKMRTKMANYHQKVPTENFDQISGIQDAQIDRMKTWLMRTSDKKNRIAFFDWDRTLTMFEGIHLVEASANNFLDSEGNPFYPLGQIREDTLRFAFGGPERLAKIRVALQQLWQKNVDIVVLTNNQGCSDANPFFLALVHQLFGAIPYSVLCSLPYEASKGRALSDNNFNFCNLRDREQSPTRRLPPTN